MREEGGGALKSAERSRRRRSEVGWVVEILPANIKQRYRPLSPVDTQGRRRRGSERRRRRLRRRPARGVVFPQARLGFDRSALKNKKTHKKLFWSVSKKKETQPAELRGQRGVHT